MSSLSLLLLKAKAGVWLLLSLEVAVIFVGVIFIRLTVPRFKLETLSRLGWVVLLGLVGGVWAVYGVGLLVG